MIGEICERLHISRKVFDECIEKTRKAGKVPPGYEAV